MFPKQAVWKCYPLPQKIDNFVSRVALESAQNSESAQPHLKKNVKTFCQDIALSKVYGTKSWHACQDMFSDLQNQ